jgi:hypothetical protein
MDRATTAMGSIRPHAASKPLHDPIKSRLFWHKCLASRIRLDRANLRPLATSHSDTFPPVKIHLKTARTLFIWRGADKLIKPASTLPVVACADARHQI